MIFVGAIIGPVPGGFTKPLPVCKTGGGFFFDLEGMLKG